MRLESLRLYPYGCFSDTTLELSEGLTVVHGVNEAGKSTILSAYAALLCGIRSDLAMDYRHAKAKLQIQAAISLDNGSRAEVIRTSKRTPNDILDSTNGNPLDAVLRQAIADGFDQKTLLTRFGLNHDRLVQGGRNLMQGAGTLADIVFEARSGTDVRVLVDDLESQMAALFGSRVNAAAAINRANATREELETSLKETMATAEAVETAAARRTSAEADLEERRRQEADRLSECSRLDQLLGSWSYWEQFRSLKNELQQLDESGPRLSPDQLRIVNDAIERLDEIQDEVLAETTAAEAAERERAGLAVAEDLLGVQPAIDTLTASRPNAKTAAARSVQLEVDAADQRAELMKALGRLGLRDIDDPLAAFAAIDISDDRLADLRNLAETNDQLHKQIHTEQNAVKEAAAQLESAQHPTGTGSDTVTSTREQRDALWRQVRLNWLEAVEIPADLYSSPGDLADDYVTAVARADNAAEGMAVEAASAAKLDERRRTLNDKKQSLEQARQALTEWQTTWDATAGAANLPQGLGVAGWRERYSLLSDAREIAEKIESINNERKAALEVATDWSTAAVALATSLGPAPGLEHIWAWFESASASYSEAKANRRAAEVHLKREAEAKKRVVQLREERSTLDALLSRAAAEHAVDRAGLSALVDRTETYARTLAELAGPEGQLRARHPDTPLDELNAEFASRHREQLSVDLESAKDALEEAKGVTRQAQENAFGARIAVEDLTGRSGADALQQELSQAAATVLELIEDYATTVIMHHLLTQELRAYLESHKNPVLDRAGIYLGRLTQGRYVALRADGDGTDRSLIVIGSDGTDYETSGLSEGTASQLYLALNLAGVLEVERERREAGKETLPIMLDDVLMAFDDDRAECALELLAEIGVGQQVVLFTHHEAVRAKAVALAGAVRTVSLAPPTPME